MDLIIQTIIYTILAVLIPYIGYRIYLYYFFRKERKKTPLMRKIEEILEGMETKEKAREERIVKTEEVKAKRIEFRPITMDEVAALTKAIEKIIFTDRDLSPAEISTLRRLGLIRFYGRYYVVTEDSFNVVRSLVEKMKKALEYNFSELDWELFENGIRALGVVIFHEEEGPMLIPISDPFLILHKLGMPPTDIYMLKTNRLVVGENTFILHRVEEKEHGRPIEHIIIAEVVEEENAKKYIEMRSNTFIKMAKQKVRSAR